MLIEDGANDCRFNTSVIYHSLEESNEAGRDTEIAVPKTRKNHLKAFANFPEDLSRIRSHAMSAVIPPL